MNGEMKQAGPSSQQHQLPVPSSSTSSKQRGSVGTSKTSGGSSSMMGAAKGPFQKSKSKEVPVMKSSVGAASAGQDLLGKSLALFKERGDA
jgi:hypothetical protein